MRIAVAGARGYVGSRLIPAAIAAGHTVVALSRRAGELPPVDGVEPVAADVADREVLTAALDECDLAYYLVHSMASGAGFAERDGELARAFAAAASAAGVGRIVYLGGLGGAVLSEHLASRHEVGRLLAGVGVPVVELRAAVVLGSGSISFEMLRYLTERLPAMVCPRWIRTRLQPIAERDLLAHLLKAADPSVPAGVYEVGGPDVTTYRQMIDAYARVRGLRRRRIIDVPLLTPSLSARWVDLVTPVDRSTSHALIESLGTEVVVTDRERTADVFALETMGVDEAIADALQTQDAAMPGLLFDVPTGVHEGVYAMHEHATVGRDDLDSVCEGLMRCGGDLGWYGLPWAWKLRILIGKPFGERLELYRPPAVVEGARVDWWTVAAVTPSSLVLRTDKLFCGEAWLGYRVERGDDPNVVQVGALRSRGLLGVVYWRLVWPIHLIVFEVMAKQQAKVKKARAENKNSQPT